MGQPTEAASTVAPPMLVVERHSSRAVGLVTNHELPGRVAVFVIWIDAELGRRGYGFEAMCLYMSHLFDQGARLVTAEVLDFNHVVNEIILKLGFKPQARLREHAYVAGAYRDVVIWSCGPEGWSGAMDRYRRVLPGGRRRLAAFGRGESG
jgi:RimJ/RimL family protein N-acetyltransferase